MEDIVDIDGIHFRYCRTLRVLPSGVSERIVTTMAPYTWDKCKTMVMAIVIADRYLWGRETIISYYQMAMGT